MKDTIFYIAKTLLQVVELIQALHHNNINDLIFVVIEALILIAEILQED